MVTVAIPALGCLTKTTWTNVPVNPSATLAPVWLVYLALPPLLLASDQPAQLPVKLTWELVSSKVVPYANRSAAVVALVAPPTVAVTSTTPDPTGLTTVQLDVLPQLTEVPRAAPNR